MASSPAKLRPWQDRVNCQNGDGGGSWVGKEVPVMKCHQERIFEVRGAVVLKVSIKDRRTDGWTIRQRDRDRETEGGPRIADRNFTDTRIFLTLGISTGPCCFLST